MSPTMLPVVLPLPICSVPALIVVMPVKVLFAVSVSVFVPLWVSEPVPLITPP